MYLLFNHLPIHTSFLKHILPAFAPKGFSCPGSLLGEAVVLLSQSEADAHTFFYVSPTYSVFALSGLAPTNHQPAKNLPCSLDSSPRSSYHFPGSHGIGPRGKKHLESRKQIHIMLGTRATLTHCTCSLTGIGFTFKTHAGGTWEWGQYLGVGPQPGGRARP